MDTSKWTGAIINGEQYVKISGGGGSPNLLPINEVKAISRETKTFTLLQDVSNFDFVDLYMMGSLYSTDPTVSVSSGVKVVAQTFGPNLPYAFSIMVSKVMLGKTFSVTGNLQNYSVSKIAAATWTITLSGKTITLVNTIIGMEMYPFYSALYDVRGRNN